MDPVAGIRLAGVVGLAGMAAGLYVAYSLWRASSALGDKGLGLASMGFLLYSMGLLLESAGAVFASGAPGAGSGRPAEVTLLLLNRLGFLSLPLFIVSYALIASSMYVGHVRVEPIIPAVPVAIGLYADLNLLGLAMLASSAYISLSRYGYARPGNILFFALAGLSHAMGLSLVLEPEWGLLAASTGLRGLAPLALVAASRVRGG